MSHIIKALKKAMQENSKVESGNTPEKVEHSAVSASSLHEVSRKSFHVDYHLLFMGVLMVFVAIGIYLNYSIFQNLTVSQNRMIQMTENLKSQQGQLDKMNKMIAQMDTSHNGQNKEFLSKIDELSLSVDQQMAEVRNQSYDQHVALSKTIEDQQAKIETLTTQYDHLDESLSNFTDVNTRYIEQLNQLKRKVAELKYKESPSTMVNN